MVESGLSSVGNGCGQLLLLLIILSHNLGEVSAELVLVNRQRFG